jgi:aflatoxin B1 aldehyde reductase
MKQMQIILGTMTFGSQVSREVAKKMVELFTLAGHRELDTAYIYNEGETEKILGRIIPKSASSLFIASKVHPMVSGSLDGHSVKQQVDESLRRLKRSSLDLCYLHMPDPNTPIESALEAIAELHEAGKVKALGLSNYSAWMVVKIWHLCKSHGWPLPTVYQGMYNAITRGVEAELLPALRDLGLRFYAYNPLAGGLLTGKYSSYSSLPKEGRFAVLPFYRDRYWKQSLFKAIESAVNECWTLGIHPAEAALRWLLYHSALNGEAGDGIIIGASSAEQLEQNLKASEAGPLPDSIAAAFDKAWEEGKCESPTYFREYRGE